jgi:hypothetical protein
MKVYPLYQLSLYDFSISCPSFRKQTSTEPANNKCATCIIVMKKKFVDDEYQMSHVLLKHKWALNVVNDSYVGFDNSIDRTMMSINKLY